MAADDFSELDKLTKTTTAAELMRKQGQRKKLKTISKKDLKLFIQEEVAKTVEAAIAGSQIMAEEDRQRLTEAAQQRVEDRIKSAQDLKSRPRHALNKRS